MSIVYVPQFHPWDKTRDLSGLAKFGTIRVIGQRWPTPSDRDPGGAIVRMARAVLVEFDPQKDYLACVGSYAHIAGVAYILGNKGLHPIRILMYDRENSGYWPLLLDPYIGEAKNVHRFRSKGDRESDESRG